MSLPYLELPPGTGEVKLFYHEPEREQHYFIVSQASEDSASDSMVLEVSPSRTTWSKRGPTALYTPFSIPLR